MTTKLRLTDRAATLLLGILLLAFGLAVLDWRFGVVFGDLQEKPLDVTPVRDVVDTEWWPWVFAAASLGLGVLGLLWLLSHLSRPGPGSARLDPSGPEGRLEADLRSVASCAAQQFSALAPVTNMRGTTSSRRGHTLVLLRGNVDPVADAATLREASAQCASDVAIAFPDDDVRLRVVLDGPRRRRFGRAPQRVRVR